MNGAVSTISPVQRSHALRVSLLCFSVAVLAATVPLSEHWLLYVIVAAMFACLAVPVWYRWQAGRLDYFEPIHIVGLIYFVYFGLGAIWTVQDPLFVAYDIHIVPYVPRAAFYCLLGYLALLGGYFAPWWRPLPPAPAPLRIPGVTLLLLPAALGLTGYAAQVVWVQLLWQRTGTGFTTTLMQLAFLFVFAWFLGWYLFFRGSATRLQKLVLFGVLTPGALLTMYYTASSKSLFLVLAGSPLVALWYARRRMPWLRLVALLLLTIFVIFPLYNTIRFYDPTLEQGERFRRTYENMMDWDEARYYDRSTRLFKKRLALINSVAVVLADVPRWVPYARGETLFYPTLALLVPRILWPNKLSTDFIAFGPTFRVIPDSDQATSIAATAPGELYWNFDLPGIVIGMLLWGVAMRFLSRRYLGDGNSDPMRIAMFYVVLVQFAFVGGTLSAEIGHMLRMVIALEALRFLALRTRMLREDPALRVPVTA